MMENHFSVEEVIGNITNSKESFTFSPLSNTCVAAYDAYHYIDKFEPNREQYEHELYFDMDITLPFAWVDPLTPPIQYPYIDSGLGDIPENSNCLQDTQEFEFSIAFSDNMRSSNGFNGVISPADDLFYKGRLLPLHLPPRIRMVERLSSLESEATELDEEDDADEIFIANGSNDHFTPSILELIDKEMYPFSCQGSLLEEGYGSKEPNSTLVRSNGGWVDMTKLQDASVFPDCYRDPTLQMLQGDANCADAKGYGRPSVGWRVFLPGSGRLSHQKLELSQESFPGFVDVRKAKEARKRGFSILTMKASASFFKSLFQAGEVGRLLVHQKGHRRHYRGPAKEEAEEEEGEEEAEGHFASVANCSRYASFGLDNQPLKAANAQAERDKIIKKAKEYLRRYVRLFKSMYVSISHTTHEQTRNLFDSSAMVDISITCRSSSCKTKKDIVNIEPKSLRTTSFSKCPKRNDVGTVDCILQSSELLYAEGAGCSSLVRSASCPEIENPIQGAIAHCKQSSSFST